MNSSLLLLAIFLFSAVPASAQKRVLVSPFGDAIPLGKSQSAVDAIKRSSARFGIQSAGACTDKATFGFTFAQNPDANTNHIGFHKDIIAMWYVAPASGSIDTVFWFQTDLGSEDSTVNLRLFNSNIYPGSGPGYDGYPSPGRLCWGYFINTNDFDNGLSAYPDDATDTTWYSTVSGPTPSFPAFGSEIWGFDGFPVVGGANQIKSVAMENLAPLDITVGDPFFISVAIFGPHVPQAEESQTGFLAVTEAESLQTHNWKFYEHIVEIQPGFTCPGWVARGDFNILFWYAMTVTTNVPPTFADVTQVNNTLSTTPQSILADIIDCNPESTLYAGVESAFLRYTLNGVPQADLTMDNIGGDTWEGTLPGGTVGDVFSYRVVASDSNGFVDSTGTSSYRVVSLSNEWYAADTGASCTDHDIRSSGNWVDTASFFLPGFSTNGAPRDDGTSGPYDMGANFVVFGDTFRYAWVGVNGAIALSKSPTDTLDVNSTGFATSTWDFPDEQKAGRTDTANAGDMPGMFIAPFWSDLIVGDTAAQYGRILYGDDGDSCLFITEYDSLGTFATTGPIPDITTFRVVLNRCTGTVEFQYVSVGTSGLDSAALVGMQADSNALSGAVPGYVYVNRNTYPFATKPRDNWCVRMVPAIGSLAIDGWNIFAVSLVPIDGNYALGDIFGTAVSDAFSYDNGYVSEDTLEHGVGYWLKFNGGGQVGGSPGTWLSGVNAPVAEGWNIFGGPTGFVPISAIDPNGVTVSSSFFGYGTSGYYNATSIQGGYGYWVKVEGSGTLDMTSAGASVPKLAANSGPEGVNGQINSLTIYDAAGRSQTLYLADKTRLSKAIGFYEMPPSPPAGAFDVRFGSQRFLEAYDGASESSVEFPISISGAVWPVGVRWDINSPPSGARKLVLANAGGIVQALDANGSLLLPESGDLSKGGLVLKLSDEGTIPGSFALSQNYPNPFNPVTRLTVDLPAQAETEVAVYDLLGRKIATLLDGAVPAGSHTVEWDGRDAGGLSVPTGMYIVRMNAGDFSAFRKIMLMK